MTKRKQKNWFQKIAEIDTKQQANVEKYNKGLNKKGSANNAPMPPLAVKILFCIALGLPIVAWALGALINPSGWISKDPFIFLYYPLYAWFISLPLVIGVIALVVNKKTDAAVIVIFIASFVYSLFILNSTFTASESEFTG